MAALPRPKDELFCQFVVQGFSPPQAYKAAGFKPDDGNAYRHRQKEHIAKRIEELQDERGEITSETIADMKGLEGLRLSAQQGLTGGNLAAAVASFKVIAEADGSLDSIAPLRMADLSDEELAMSVVSVFRNYDAAMGRKVRADHEIVAGIVRSMGFGGTFDDPAKPKPPVAVVPPPEPEPPLAA